jgi:uncharacterized membrane protein
MRKTYPGRFFTEEEKEKLVEAIRRAEEQTSGEIRVHLAHRCKKEPMEEARSVFEKLGMTRTAERNGILFFLSLKDRRFVVLGDQGIHEKIRDEFWREIRDEVLGHFKGEKFLEGLLVGIRKCGESLARFFPRKKSDRNELPNEVTSS